MHLDNPSELDKNLLLNEEKAIVSNIPGTTRDAIEDTIILDGIKFRFVDTAGLRNTDDEIESKGIEITKAKISKASVLIYLFDINDSTESEIINDLKQFSRDDLSIILVRNKINDFSCEEARNDNESRG